MKRKQLEPEAVEAFLTQMRQLATEWSNDDVTTTLEDALHLWAAGEVSDYINEHRDHIVGEKAQREFRQWLRNEPTRMVRLIDAARRGLAGKRRAK